VAQLCLRSFASNFGSDLQNIDESCKHLDAGLPYHRLMMYFVYCEKHERQQRRRWMLQPAPSDGKSTSNLPPVNNVIKLPAAAAAYNSHVNPRQDDGKYQQRPRHTRTHAGRSVHPG